MHSKVCREDKIINEYIKNTSDIIIDIYDKLVNVVFDSGILPSIWLIGMIKPINKNKNKNNGDPNDPHLTAILNARLSTFLKSFLC